MQKLLSGIVRFTCVLLAAMVSSGARAASPSSSDDYITQVWDTDSGLPQSTVTSIVQTPDGYLWVGTVHGGLARFDGAHFVNFQPGNTPELKSIEIRNLFVDAEGTLWVHTVEGGLISCRDGKFRFEYGNSETPASWLIGILSDQPGKLRFVSESGMIFSRIAGPNTNHWETFSPPDNLPIDTVCEDASGVMWCLMKNNTLAQIHDGKIVNVPAARELRGSRINVLTKDNAGRIWVGTPKEMACWNGNAFVDMTPTNGESDLNVNQLFGCADGSFWVLADDHLRRCFARNWNADAKLWDGDQPDRNARRKVLAGLTSLSVDSSGGIWFAHSELGIGHASRDGQISWVHDPQHLATGTVHCWYEDREGNIWIGLSDGGLARLRRRVFHTVWPADGADSKAACSVCEGTDGTMWFGTHGRQVLGWNHDGFKETDLLPVPSEEVKILPGNDGRLWVGSVQGGVFELANREFHQPFPAEAIAGVARCLYLDRQNILWIGSEFGLFSWDGKNFKSFSSKDGFLPAYVLSLAEDKNGGMWFGTALGELRCLRAGQFQTFLPDDSLTDKTALNAEASANPFNSQNRGALSGGERFWSLHFDNDDVLWIGTLGRGLLRFKDGKFTRFTRELGLPGDDINQILEDNHGQLWLGTGAGIVRVAKRELNNFADVTNAVPPTFVTYDKSDGLPALECTGGMQPNCWRSRDGRLWFTTVKGAGWINPNELAVDSLAPQIHLEEFRLDGKSQLEPGSLASQPVTRPPKKVSVAAGQHYYEFKFCAPSLAAPDKVKFKWRLANLEHAWVDGGGHDSANYSFIPPGTYQFEVLACNSDGVWSSAPADMELTVLPYFWQRWWFKVVVGFCVVAALFTIYSVKVSRLRALERLRVRIARDLHDEVGANLASIGLLAQIMEKSPSTSDAVQISNIAAQTVETLRDIIWFIDPKHNNLSDLVLRLQESSRIMLVAMPHKFEQAGDFDSPGLSLSFRRNVPAIFKETLHNVVKHSHATEVAITVSRVGKKFQFRVQDNGVGFRPEASSTGNGLKNMRRRTNEIHAQLIIDSAPGRGAITTLLVPIG